MSGHAEVQLAGYISAIVCSDSRYDDIVILPTPVEMVAVAVLSICPERAFFKNSHMRIRIVHRFFSPSQTGFVESSPPVPLLHY
ncbi:MAG TPA: hypothetical protein ENL01_05125 [Chlorobaculum parvum]|uniref:Uncharacterized protein n=1 Tax=Chlorobaculum parvum TaxID=274539 RepID=A0A7C5HL79_9CHLB|nr:hypothetical protein [Chlorobaculum parvum]